MFIRSAMLPNYLILSLRPLLLYSISPSIKVFSNKLALPIRWPKDWSFIFSISPCNEYSGLISFRIDWLELFYWCPVSVRFGIVLIRSLHFDPYGNHAFSTSHLASESLHSDNNVLLCCFLQEGEKWEDGPCKVCECRGAQVTCYEPSCPPCPVATLAQAVEGQCCPDCTSGGSMTNLCLLSCPYCHTIQRDLLSSCPLLIFLYSLTQFVCLFLLNFF